MGREFSTDLTLASLSELGSCMSKQTDEDVKKDPEETMSRGLGRVILEPIVTVWVIGVMAYYYYDKGYPELLVQIWRSFFG